MNIDELRKYKREWARRNRKPLTEEQRVAKAAYQRELKRSPKGRFDNHRQSAQPRREVRMNKRDYKIWWTGKDWCLSRRWIDENGGGWCSVARTGWRWPLRIAARIDAWQFRRRLKNYDITEEFSA